ncbi:transporter [Dokdonia pacifica]|uniref:Outer membrane protein n=1 Tax=Dokdonia pacifica TaxID=1627892 RepID=A0A238VT10_9FLAO|nr:TolC family protein [Dokdonia pacifica]GGG18717.1 transporter [Dokdonia pacifica]SNR36639.1 outer membrane protein [Dokdonia pacifica]
MRKLFIICFSLFISVAGFAQNKKWTLQECVQYALDNNITIKQTQLDEETAAIEKKDAIGNYLPTLNGNASNNWNSGLTQNITTGVLETQTLRNSSYSITAGVRIFNGFRNKKALDRAELSRIAADYNIAKIKDDTALSVALAYLQVLLNKENLKTVVAQNQVTKEQVSRTQELVDGGVLPSGDLLEIKATDASERQRIVAAQNAVKISLINLAQLLAFDDYDNFEIEDTEYNILGEEILNTSPEVLLEKAKESRYDLKIVEQNLAIAKKDLELSKASLYPTINGFFNYNTRESGAPTFSQTVDPNNPSTDVPIGFVEGTNQTVFTTQPNILLQEGNPTPFIEQLYLNDGISYGVQLSVPIFNGFSTRNNIKRSEVNVKRSEFQSEQARLNFESAVYQAYTDAKAAKESYEAAIAALTSQELAYEYAKLRYDVGRTNAFDFSQSKLRYDNAQVELTRSKYDYIFRIKVLELYFGVPATELKF